MQVIGRAVGSAGATALALVVAVLLILASDFYRRTTSNIHNPNPPSLAVVFTGQFNRLALGFEMLRTGQIEKLVVSGFNPGAGLQLSTLPKYFNVQPREINAWLESGQLHLGTQANYTIENAIEVRKMLQNTKVTQLILITGECHMPRSSLLLEGELNGVQVQRMPVPGGCETPLAIANEFFKYLYSFAYRVGYLEVTRFI